jgi:hypothetical protein
MNKTKVIKGFLIFLFNIFICIFIIEVFSRLFLKLRRESDFISPKSVARFYYPELNSSLNKSSTGSWNILFLGASVVHKGWGSVEKEILRRIKERTSIPVMIHNMGVPSHTLKDSLIKYNILKSENINFDKVFIYHGINDVPMNNYPFKIYEHNYSHAKWYCDVNPLMEYNQLYYTATRYVTESIWNRLVYYRSNTGNSKFGNKIKTRKAFSDNLEEICKISKINKEELLLSTFAIHTDDNYTIENFRSKRLDYKNHTLPIEVWGEVKNVIKTVDIHNEIIKEFTNDHNITLININKDLPKNKDIFNDICHLTEKGSKAFAKIIVPYLIPK